MAEKERTLEQISETSDNITIETKKGARKYASFASAFSGLYFGLSDGLHNTNDGLIFTIGIGASGGMLASPAGKGEKESKNGLHNSFYHAGEGCLTYLVSRAVTTIVKSISNHF